MISMVDVTLSAVLTLISASQEFNQCRVITFCPWWLCTEVRSYRQRWIKADQGLTAIHGNWSSYQGQLPKGNHLSPFMLTWMLCSILTPVRVTDFFPVTPVRCPVCWALAAHAIFTWWMNFSGRLWLTSVQVSCTLAFHNKCLTLNSWLTKEVWLILTSGCLSKPKLEFHPPWILVYF